MAQVHFGTFLGFTKKAYQGNGKGSKRAIFDQLKEANFTGNDFAGFWTKVKSYATHSAEAEGAGRNWRDGDLNLDASFEADKGDAEKAAAFHFYFLSHDEYAARAKALNDAINLPKLMDGQFEAAVFGFRTDDGLNTTKRVHPIPPRPTAPFEWPVYISEEEANAPNADEGIWLNPFNHFSIPFSHRLEEQKLLDAFIADERPFLICALVASSGAGKTRLVSQWMRKLVPNISDTDWDAGFLRSRNAQPWETWSVTRNTLIVIDYTYGYDDAMKAIAQTCRYHQDKSKRVRLLVADHIYPEALNKDFFWSQQFGSQDQIDGLKNRVLFEKSPIEIQGSRAGSPFLREIIAATASKPEKLFSSDDPIIVEAETVLSKMGIVAHSGSAEAARHPLFAALMGQAIRDEKSNYLDWSRRDLIKHYFDKPSRLPWVKQDAKEDDSGLWVGMYVAAATLLRGVSLGRLRSFLPESLRARHVIVPNADKIAQASGRLVSSSNRKILKPLEPDILGESFLLQFFALLRDERDSNGVFLKILADAELTPEPLNAAVNFLETVRRLTRNLLNEDQELRSVDDAWDCLDDFLSPKNSPKTSLIRQSVSIARADIVRQCHAARISGRAEQFAKKIDFADMEAASAGQLCVHAAIAFLHYFEWSSIHHPIEAGRAVSALAAIGKNYRGRSKHSSSALMLAAAQGCVEAAKSLHKELEEDINVPSGGQTILAVSAHLGRKHVVSWLLANGAEVNQTCKNHLVAGRTALMAASESGHFDIVALLLARGADSNLATVSPPEKNAISKFLGTGATALMLACDEGHAECAAILLNHGASVEAAMIGGLHEGKTAFMMACERGRTDIGTMLLRWGANINQTTTGNRNAGTTALMLACKQGHIETIEMLLSAGADTSLETVCGFGNETALITACTRNHLSVVKLLLKHGADPNHATAERCETPLMAAAGKGYQDITALLLEHGANVNYPDAHGRTALQKACLGSHAHTVLLLLERGAHVNHSTAAGETALMSASIAGNRDTIAILRKHGANIHQVTNGDFLNVGGRTALMVACLKGHTDAARMLLEFGAEIDQTDEDGKTALMLACENGRAETAAMLLDQGASIDCVSTRNQTSLMLACQKGHPGSFTVMREYEQQTGKRVASFRSLARLMCIQVLNLLLNRGIAINAVDEDGLTALDFIMSSNNSDLVDLLRQAGGRAGEELSKQAE